MISSESDIFEMIKNFDIGDISKSDVINTNEVLDNIKKVEFVSKDAVSMNKNTDEYEKVIFSNSKKDKLKLPNFMK